MENKSQHSIEIFVDSTDHLYQVKFTSQDGELTHIFNTLIPYLIQMKLDEAYHFSKKSLPRELLDVGMSDLKFEQAMALIRKQIKAYWGEISPAYIMPVGFRETLICRCKGIDQLGLNKSYIEYQGNVEKIYQQTDIAGVCGSCFNEVDKLLSSMEENEVSIFGKDKDEWIKTIDELLEEFQMMCPPEFSQLSFAFISITPRMIRIKCSREAKTPTRPDIQNALNNFFKGQLPQDIPVSVIL